MNAITTAFLAGVMLLPLPSAAQWPKQRDRGVPRTHDGKPNLSAPVSRTREGKPNLSGVWLPEPDPKGKPQGVEQEVFPRYFVSITADLKPEEVPFTAPAAATFKKHVESQGRADPIAHCQPTGVPRIGTIPLPYKIVQMPQLIIILYEENTVFRQIFLDGRQLPNDPEPRYMGYSVGRWEGDTLIVDSTGFNDRSWLDGIGHPHSDQLHVIERFLRRDIGHLDVQVTIDDSKTYTKPLMYTQRQTLLPDDELFEHFCTDNEKDIAHYK